MRGEGGEEEKEEKKTHTKKDPMSYMVRCMRLETFSYSNFRLREN